MTNLRAVFSLVILLLASASTFAADSFRGAGISRQVARARKASVSNLVYDLHFDIPEAPDMPVKGNVLITFCFSDSDNRFESLPVDFRPGAAKVGAVMVNGRAIAPEIEDEHIYIPARYLRQDRDSVSISFESADRHLNRREGYMYTLFVPDRANTVFPCFEQPDLKAEFNLTLSVPAGWECVSNSAVISRESIGNGRDEVKFASTEPLSTYLFAFAAGEFTRYEKDVGGRKIEVLHRETDPQRLAQLDLITDEVNHALKWQEDFTGVKYPFAKYDLVILPGFQFGGMEHTGATFYNDTRVFVPETATPAELLARTTLIDHETTHMWFGDYVTMEWFDDVWTKEVFANYFAAQIARLTVPEFDHDLVWLSTYVAAALSEDRGSGATAIQQELGNLKDAGLVYNNIIYNKAPVMMSKLVDLMGEDAFREGIREYVNTYGYSNATWNDLVACLQRHTSAPVDEFSRVWVSGVGIPHISLSISGNELIVRQGDPTGEGKRWPQRFDVALAADDKGFTTEIEMTAQSDEVRVNIPDGFDDALIIPNSDGRGYALFKLGRSMNSRLAVAAAADSLPALSPSGRMATWMNLNENRLAGEIDDDLWIDCLLQKIGAETDAISACDMVDYLNMALSDKAPYSTDSIEARMLHIAGSHPAKAVRIKLLRSLMSFSSGSDATDSLYSIWDSALSPLLGENDYMNMAWELAIRMPAEADSILGRQRGRLSNPDRICQFDFISPAVSPAVAVRDSLFARLLTPGGRQVEPWARKALSLLNHRLRDSESVRYIRPALDVLPEVQATGDIFFPGGWCASLLSAHRSDEASAALYSYLADNPDIKKLLLNKILNGAYFLTRGKTVADAAALEAIEATKKQKKR